MEYIFRGIAVSNGEWVYGDLKHLNENTLFINDWKHKFWYEPEMVKPETVGQFTQRKDSKGKRIFAGDILRFEHPAFDKAITGVVVWHKDDSGWDLRTRRGKMTDCGLGYAEEFYTVIGNIYEESRKRKTASKRLESVSDLLDCKECENYKDGTCKIGVVNCKHLGIACGCTGLR